MSTLFQISASNALVEGVYSGSVFSSVLLEHGDFGIGTFEGLDGEMVILDGQIYQVTDRVRHRTDDFLVPFASITHFRAKSSFEIDNVACLRDIELACDQQRISDNLFSALRLDGIFETIHARAVHTVPQNTRLLDAAKTQSAFHFENIEGTLVGFWSPRYSSSFSIPGYHLHFISKDRTKGGHVLDCTAQKLKAGIQVLSEFDIRLPDSGPFLTTNLSKDPASDLAKTEKQKVITAEPSRKVEAKTKLPIATGADVVVETLEAQGVTHVFGVPGAKIDKVFDRLRDSKIKTVVCRHEQNAAFIAGGIGRMTGKAGVAIATSGPGVSNLTTGLATANSEGDPVVALGGAVATSEALKQIHQTMDAVSILKPVTKFSATIGASDQVNEVLANAFRAAESGRPGAAYVNLPRDVMTAPCAHEPLALPAFAG